MREIKFRQLITLQNGGKIWHYWGFIKDGFISPQNHQDPSQQFTGLEDKNGKEIYEGDIMNIGNSKDYNFEVIWGYIGYELKNYTDNRGKFKGWITRDSREVIGNIYENPELLK